MKVPEQYKLQEQHLLELELHLLQIKLLLVQEYDSEVQTPHSLQIGIVYQLEQVIQDSLLVLLLEISQHSLHM